jgi:integrase
MASIRTREGAKGQTHQVIWYEPITRKQRSETYNDLRLAKKRLTVIKGLLAQETAPLVPDKLTYGQWYGRWMDEDVAVRLTPKVRSQYEGLHKKLILPFWAKVSIHEIDPDRVSAWIQWMKTQTKSAWTMREAYVSMSSCLAFAIPMKKLKANPLSGLRRLLPKPPKGKDPIILTPQQIVALSGAVQPRYKALVVLLGTHGLRPSEAFALTLADVDAVESTVKVTKAVVNNAGRMELKNETKTGEDREVHLASFVLDALITHVGEFCDPTEPDSLLFPSENKGSYIHIDFFTSWQIKRAGEKIGVPHLTTYDLRHSANKNMLRHGKDPRFATDQLGNSPEVNAVHYNHSTSEDIARANALLEAEFKKYLPGEQQAS